MCWIGRNFPVMLTVKVALICLLTSILLIDTVFASFGLKVYFLGEAYGKGVWSRFRISFFDMSCSSIIKAMRLSNVSFYWSKNCLLGSILPVVPFLLEHSIDFNKRLAQPSVSAIWPPKSFSFDGQFALITPVPIAMTIFLETTPPAIRTPVTTSFTFTRNSWSKSFVLPFLLCTVALSFFCLFRFFLLVIYWCSCKGIFRIFFPKFLQCRFCFVYQSVFANLILNAFWNWGVIILSR